MITPVNSRRLQAGAIQLIIAILIIIIGAIIIYKLARLIHKVIPPPGTNTVSVGYQVEYGQPSLVYHPAAQTFPPVTMPTNGFTFSYGCWNSNICWATTTNPVPQTNGQVAVIINTPSEFAVAINMNGYEQFLAYDGNTGAELENSSNGVCSMVIEKSTDLVNWSPIYTNDNCTPGAVQTYTDTNSVEPQAFYRAATQ